MEFSKKQIRLFQAAIDPAFIKPSRKKGFSSINSIAITDRLNEIFGIDGWCLEILQHSSRAWVQKTQNGERPMFTGMVKVRMTFKHFEILRECVATSDNDDEGDAIKGAISDCFSKMCSWFGIASHVWKNLPHATRGDLQKYIAMVPADAGDKKQEMAEYVYDLAMSKFAIGRSEQLWFLKQLGIE